MGIAEVFLIAFVALARLTMFAAGAVILVWILFSPIKSEAGKLADEYCRSRR